MMIKAIAVTKSNIQKYGRMDAHFYINIKPMVDEFLRGHSVDNKGKIKPLKRRKPLSNTSMTTQEYVLIYALVQYYNAFAKISKATKELQKSMSFELGDD